MKALAHLFRYRNRLAARRAKSGQTLTEYALITSVISVVAIAIYALINAEITTIFSGISNILDTAQGS